MLEFLATRLIPTLDASTAFSEATVSAAITLLAFPVLLKLAAKFCNICVVVLIGLNINFCVATKNLNPLELDIAAFSATNIDCPTNPIAPVIAAATPNTGTAITGISANAATNALIGVGALANASTKGVNTFIIPINAGASAEPKEIPKSLTWFIKIFI